MRHCSCLCCFQTKNNNKICQFAFFLERHCSVNHTNCNCCFSHFLEFIPWFDGHGIFRRAFCHFKENINKSSEMKNPEWVTGRWSILLADQHAWCRSLYIFRTVMKKQGKYLAKILVFEQFRETPSTNVKKNDLSFGGKLLKCGWTKYTVVLILQLCCMRKMIN